ncbi:MAG: hypothetical protein FWC73_13540 [Defluviitaleaceae bacterium]|nr:hypothetical protein [Defluviitaleaceae bacterium]
MKRKWLILTLVLCLAGLLAFTACNRNGDTDEPDVPPEQAQATPEPPPPDDDPDDDDQDTGDYIPADPFGRFDETVHVTQTRILAGWMGFDEGENEDYNWWTRAYYEHLNVSLTNLFTADSWGEPFDMAINLAFATGDLPDVMPLYTSLAVRALEGGLVMDITDILERHASQQVHDIFATDPRALEAWSVDGRVMGLSRTLGLPTFPFFWIPESMLNEFNGGVIPTTFEEFNELAHWVVDYTGGYAIGLEQTLGYLEDIVAMFGATEQWIERGGELVWGRIQPEMRDAWAQLAEWYQSGILAIDFAVRTADDVESDFVNRRMGLLPGGTNVPDGSRGRNYMLLNPDDDLVAIPMMSATAAPINVIRSGGYNDVLMVSASSSYEVAVAFMRMYNLGTAVANDGERPDWVVDSSFDNSPGGNMAFWNRMGTGNGNLVDTRPQYDTFSLTLEALTTGSRDDLVARRAFSAIGFYDRIMNWVNYGTDVDNWESHWALWNMYLGTGSLLTSQQMFHNGFMSYSPRWGVETAAEASYNANLNSRFIEFVTVAIMNNDVDNQFEQWVRFFEENGGAEINAQVNEWWAANR